jgi:L-threonate 2-dehydrogenase
VEQTIPLSRRVGIGLGSMGCGVAQSLPGAGFDVRGFDVSTDACRCLESEGASPARGRLTPRAARLRSSPSWSNVEQTEVVLFGDNGAASSMAHDTVFVSCATMAP